MDVAEQQERFEVISKFADGERVDSRALLAALADEAGREYLIDLVAIREIARQTEGRRADDRTLRISAPTRSVEHRRALTGLAAVLALAVGFAGYAIGQQRSQVASVAVLSPLAADVVVAVEAPPAPTQVIRLGSGVPGDGGR